MIVFPRSLLIGAGLLLLAGCGPDPAALLDRARSAIAAADDQAARLDLLGVLRARPEDPTALALLAEVQLRLGDGEGAITALDRLEAVRPPNPSSRRLRAEAELLRGKPAAALALIAQDRSAQAWRLRAAAALAQGDQAAAIAAYDSGLRAGADARLLVDYARLLLAAEDRAGALRLLTRLKQMAPKDFATLLLEGDVLSLAQNSTAAGAAYRAAAAAAPQRIEPLLGQAGLADAAGDDAAVERWVKAAEALAPDDPRVRHWRVQVAQLNGDWETVRRMLAPRESELDPRSPEGLAYAEALLNLGQPEQARALFRRTLALSPQNPYARLMLAEAELATGDAGQALETVRPLAGSAMAGDRELDLAERAARAAGLPEAGTFAQRRTATATTVARQLAGAGQAAYARGDWAAATAAYAALSARGEDAEVLRRLALAAGKAGQTDLAIRSADRALALQPNNPDTLFAAGVVRCDGGRDPIRGLALLEAAAAADPANALFRAALARVKARQAGG
ncbi:tetratricopeptide repeat protein [Novosphingobium piscinae]|uniref:Tetratricopeptide repeat protein n=1 Tax=Novosphingobium piscinae TaxID=1507448 RepID=A0A7X1FYN0_9SPHN|nr:tetratricopeptide repeat protein [Novosphingobium piscinae]MBC2669413.1 tetratricopeptide repeat protein [Novosphingobium piscinae]